mmetsp:Transcript_28828/g.35138  ORF Transcript_28828/g.35138 Transcript_28828/m.35138 type:complete len:311 (+) Transcript_28828:959-1891(+)
MVCTATLSGSLHFGNLEGENIGLLYVTDGQKDIAGGRKMNDRNTADTNASSRYFTSVCYSADGRCVLAGGNSRFVCIYEVSQQILLKKFQVSYNRGWDGVLDELNSKLLGESGTSLDVGNNSDEEGDVARMAHLPGAKRNDDGSRRTKPEIRTTCVRFSSTGREWATVSTEGLLIYSLDDDLGLFDPIQITEEVTPLTIQTNCDRGDYTKALVMALQLNEYSLVHTVLESTPVDRIAHVVPHVSPASLERLLQYVAKSLQTSPHVEFYLEWTLQLLQVHGSQGCLSKYRGRYIRAIKSLHKVISGKNEDL